MAHSPIARLAPAFACAVALLTDPGSARAEDSQISTAPSERPNLTAGDYLSQSGAREPTAPLALPGLHSGLAFDHRALMASPAFEPSYPGSAAEPSPGFWLLRSSLEPGWQSSREEARPSHFLQGRAFDVAYGLRFDKRQRFEAMASWGYLSLGAGKTKEGFTAFGGVMLPFEQQGVTLRLGAEVGKKSPRMMLGVDVQLGGRD